MRHSTKLRMEINRLGQEINKEVEKKEPDWNKISVLTNQQKEVEGAYNTASARDVIACLTALSDLSQAGHSQADASQIISAKIAAGKTYNMEKKEWH